MGIRRKNIVAFWGDICYNGLGQRVSVCKDGFPSGQRGQTVNLLQIASVVRIHLHPVAFSRGDAHIIYGRRLPPVAMRRLVWRNRQTQGT